MSDRFRADLGLIYCSAIWGATFLVMQDALRDASVLALLAVRFALAAALMALIFRRDLLRATPAELGAGVLVGLLLFSGYVLQTNGLRFTTPAKTAFINGFAVVLVPIMLAVFFRKAVNAWVWAGVAAAFAGLYLLSVPASAQGLADMNTGDLLVLVAAVMWALHILLIARFTKRYSVGVLSTMQVATTAVLAGVLVPIVNRSGWEPLHFDLTAGLVWRVLLTSAGCTAIGFSIQVWAQRHTSPTHVGILLTLEPVFAALTSWLAGRERLGRRELAGGALILFGILLAELMAAQAAPESPGPADEAAGTRV